jgi:hypothetical protein
VEEENPAHRVGDDRSLVADHEIVEARLLEVRPHRPEHASGDHDDVCARRARPPECFLRARPQQAVLGDQRPVEVEREGGDGPREGLRELDRYGALPPVESTT